MENGQGSEQDKQYKKGKLATKRNSGAKSGPGRRSVTIDQSETAPRTKGLDRGGRAEGCSECRH